MTLQNSVTVYATSGPGGSISVTADGQYVAIRGVDESTGSYTFNTNLTLTQATIRVDYSFPSSYPLSLGSYVTVNGQTAAGGVHSNGCSNGSCMGYAEYIANNYPPPATFTEDACQRVDYSYDTNPYDGSFSQYTLGRLAAVQYKGGYTPGVVQPTCTTTFTEMYSYSQAGGVLKKRMQVSVPAQNYGTATDISMNLDSAYTYDNEGRMTATQYPSWWNGGAWVAGPNLGNTFDSMGHLQKTHRPWDIERHYFEHHL